LVSDVREEKMPKPKEPTRPVGTVAELFAGVGGFRHALEPTWSVVYSNQWEPSTKAQHASDVYVARFGSEGHTNEDIAVVLDDYEAGKIEIPKTTMLVGGFPCQDYSVAKSLNSSKGLEGKKGVLWWEILRLVRLNRPPIVFLENVDRLLKSPASQRGRDFAIMLASLSDEGYFVEWRVVNAAEYGFKQRRRRVFIVAKDGRFFRAPEVDALSVLLKSGTLAKALPVKAEPKSPSLGFDLVGDLAEISSAFGIGLKASPFRNGGYMLGRSVTTVDLIPVPVRPGTLASVLVDETLVPESFFVEPGLLDGWERLKGAKRQERTHPGGGKYFYSEGGMAFPDSVDKPARTILTGEGGSSASRFKHIIQTPSGRFRRLMPIELERLNGFPDDWTATSTVGPVSDVKRAFFMGNALVVGVVEKIGKQLAEEISLLSKP
jgi:DNA (cytosine-5)-methyltransferase 1